MKIYARRMIRGKWNLGKFRVDPRRLLCHLINGSSFFFHLKQHENSRFCMSFSQSSDDSWIFSCSKTGRVWKLRERDKSSKYVGNPRNTLFDNEAILGNYAGWVIVGKKLRETPPCRVGPVTSLAELSPRHPSSSKAKLKPQRSWSTRGGILWPFFHPSNILFVGPNCNGIFSLRPNFQATKCLRSNHMQ